MKKNKLIAVAAAAVMAAAPICTASGNSYKTNFSPIEVSAASYAKNTEGFVARMYLVVLGRNPDLTGLKNWADKLNNHTATASDIIYGFFCSDEYKGRKKSNEEIVTDCYKAMLNRNPDSQGKASWLARLDSGMTVMSVCRGFVGSSEFKALCAEYGIDTGNITLSYTRDENFERTNFVYRLYANCLGRKPDIAGLENWCSKLKSGTTGKSIAKGFIFSSEYTGRNTGNEEFVKMLYSTILGRAADSAGLSGWVSQLDKGKSRQAILDGFIYSTEFKQQCSKAGIILSDVLPSSDNRYGAAPKRYDVSGLTYMDGMLIANKSYMMPSDFNPGLDSTCKAQFDKLSAAAKAEGLNIWLASGFRSYSYQKQIYWNNVNIYGQAKTDTFSAKPGSSEHQSGLAIDVNSIDDTFINTPECNWLAEHCHEYGFIIRYPKGKQDITGYKYEPWHIRYVGTDMAYKLRESGLTVEEYFGIDSVYR